VEIISDKNHANSDRNGDEVVSATVATSMDRENLPAYTGCKTKKFDRFHALETTTGISRVSGWDLESSMLL
jgi:hypothetical protein